jgi:SOS-response transcriptional repressor LexA
MPRFASYVSRLGRITELTTDLVAQTGTLLPWVTDALDDVGDRVGQCESYQGPYDALLRAHAAIESAYAVVTRLHKALTGEGSPPQPTDGERVGQVARSPWRQAAPARVRDPASEETWEVPILGTVTAGMPNVPPGQVEFISIPPQDALRRNVIVVRVSGDSMAGDGLHDGDYVIVDRGGRFRDGDIAVVRVGHPDADTDLVVKHVWRERNGLRLEASSPQYPPIALGREDEPVIEGTVIGMFRPTRDTGR